MIQGLLLLVSLLQAAAPDPPPTDLRGVKGADVDLLEQVRAIGAAVASIRGETFDRLPVALRVPEDICRTAATIRARSALPSERLEARGRAWAAIGLGSETSPTALVQLLAEDVSGGCFDPDGNRLLVLPGLLPARDWVDSEEAERSDLGFATGVDPDEPLISHLLMHVRQHERNPGGLSAETTDGLVARAARDEGEANLVAIRYLFSGMGLADEVVSAGLGPDEVLSGALLPPDLARMDDAERLLAEFVYLDGWDRASARFRESGWSGLLRDRARQATTRDIIHPQRERGAPVEFAEPSAPKGLRLADTDSLGEQGVVVLVSLTTGKDNLGLLTGDGWAGDRLYRWEAPADPRSGVTEWVTRWVTEQAAQDFVYGFARSLKGRYGRGPAVPSPGVGELTAGGRHFRIERQGREVRVLVKETGAAE